MIQCRQLHMTAPAVLQALRGVAPKELASMRPHHSTVPSVCRLCHRGYPSRRDGAGFCSQSCALAYRRQRAADPIVQAAQFWRHVQRSDDSGACWVWQGATDRRGYGSVRHGDHTDKAHRVAWVLAYGPLPDGAWVLHRCDNRPCCRPAHLFLGDAAANMQDMAAKRRQWLQQCPARVQGEGNRQAKLTDALVRTLRQRYATGMVRLRDLAQEYGLGRSTVGDAVRGRRWKHVQ